MRIALRAELGTDSPETATSNRLSGFDGVVRHSPTMQPVRASLQRGPKRASSVTATLATYHLPHY